MKTKIFTHKSGFCLLLLLLALCLPRLAFAADILPSEDCGTCVVSIDANGELLFKTQNSTDSSCEIDARTFNDVPWDSHRSSVKSIKVETGKTMKYILNNSGYADLFQGFTLCTDWSGLSAIDVSGITTMSEMFKGSSLKSSDLQYIKNWDISNVDVMQSAFEGCANLTNVDDLASWKDKVSKVYIMSQMFYQCTSLENVDGLAGWNTPALKYMEEMFSECGALYNVNGLSGWDVSHVLMMMELFNECTSLTSDALLPLSTWNVSGAGNMRDVFNSCSGLTDLNFLSGWKVSGVTTMQGMFQGCAGLTNIDGIKNWDVSNVTVTALMFAGCGNLTHLDLSAWDLSGVDQDLGGGWTGQDFMFNGVPAGLPLQIRQYYPVLGNSQLGGAYPETPYVYGKHSYRDFENAAASGLTENPSGWTFEPCTLTVSFTGGTFNSTTTGTADAKTFYDKVKVFTNGVSAYDKNALYFAADDTVTLTFTPTDPTAVIESVKATTGSKTVELQAPYSFTITGNTTVEVTLQSALATITLNLDSGTGDVSVFQNVHVNDTIILPELTKPGYIFKGWDVDGDGVADYIAGQEYTIPSAELTLNAIFSDLTGSFTITYEMGEAESGTVPAAQQATAGETVKLAHNSGGLKKAGYEFYAWSDGVKWYFAGSDFQMPDEDVTMVPVFAALISEDPLPEDEIGTYYFNENGQKEYVQFHNYAICMNYMGDDSLCRNTSTNLYN